MLLFYGLNSLSVPTVLYTCIIVKLEQIELWILLLILWSIHRCMDDQILGHMLCFLLQGHAERSFCIVEHSVVCFLESGKWIMEGTRLLQLLDPIAYLGEGGIDATYSHWIIKTQTLGGLFPRFRKQVMELGSHRFMKRLTIDPTLQTSYRIVDGINGSTFNNEYQKPSV